MIDQIVLINAGISFLSFVFMHTVLARLRKLIPVYTLIMISFYTAAVVNLGGFIYTLTIYSSQNLGGVLICVGGVILSFVLLGVLAFLYIVCVFGPSESSIRIRVLLDLAQASGHGLSWEKILENYNARTMVDIRLKRCLEAGDVVFDGKVYRLVRPKNVFFIIDAAASGLKRLYG